MGAIDAEEVGIEQEVQFTGCLSIQRGRIGPQTDTGHWTLDTGHWTGYIWTQQPQAASSHCKGHTIMYSCEVKSFGQGQVENTSNTSAS